MERPRCPAQLCSPSLSLPALSGLARRFPNSTVPWHGSPAAARRRTAAQGAGEPFRGPSEAGRRRGPRASSCSTGPTMQALTQT